MIMKDLKILRMTKQLDPQSMSPTIAPNQKLEETTVFISELRARNIIRILT